MTRLRELIPPSQPGTVQGVPQVARQLLFSAHEGKAVLLTTPERLAVYQTLDLWGAEVSFNPGIPEWAIKGDRVVLDVSTALDLFPRDPESLTIALQIGKDYPRDALFDRLISLGYQREEEPGYTVKGDTLTIHLGGERVIRAEFFGDELDTLRDGEGQKLRSFIVPPAEGFLPPSKWDATRLELLSEYRVFLDAPELYSSVLEPNTPQLWQLLMPRDVVSFGRTPIELPDIVSPVKTLPFYRAQLTKFARDLERWLEQEQQVLVLLRHERTGKYLQDKLLSGLNIKWVKNPVMVPGQASFLVGIGEGGFEIPDQNTVVVTEDLLYGFQGGSALRSKRLSGKPVTDALGLQVGDYLIHPEHGIGQFLGIETREVLGVKRDYLHLQYGAGAKIYLPIELLPIMRRHPGTTDDPPSLSRLEKQEWQKAKEKARQSAEALAAKLLVQYAARQVTPGYAFTPLEDWDPLIEKNFEYELTFDQKRALRETLNDLEKTYPMDRLISGDVGFGKTEVAIRAAHRVVGHGKQVAVLVPTTLLAEQHASTFNGRFRDLPVRIEGLSRFTTPAQSRSIMEGLKAGSVDIIIGTHRLLSEDIEFKNLGLIIIDEEHRFGVLQKEKLKALKAFGKLEGIPEPETAAPADTTPRRRGRPRKQDQPSTNTAVKDAMAELKNQVSIDVLSMSATPIPRTLYMSMVGLRDMSSIQTPPKGRKPIQTILSPYDPTVVRHAIISELERGGKVFYIHDRIASIGARALYLKNIVPEARVAVAHGRMDEEQLEEIMLGFEEGAFDVLLSTTIVETGLDIPEANTILIERADRLGLAQLYQLRGRVGRRSREAYAYMFYPPRLTGNASRRLWAIADLQDLGSGHRLAEKDMEIRGVGNILGSEQHGQIQAVSIEVYTELLAEAVARLKGDVLPEPTQISIDLPVDARLTAEYFGDESARIQAYGMLSEATTLPAISRVEKDFRKRFGVPPTEVQHFLDLAKLRIIALNKRVLSISENITHLVVSFSYKGLDFDAASLKRFPHRTEVAQFPPSVKIEKKGLKPDDYPRVLMDVLTYFG
nr:DEAD/DEAH box helicase [Deinococcus cellulosilyticus]